MKLNANEDGYLSSLTEGDAQSYDPAIRYYNSFAQQAPYFQKKKRQNHEAQSICYSDAQIAFRSTKSIDRTHLVSTMGLETPRKVLSADLTERIEVPPREYKLKQQRGTAAQQALAYELHVKKRVAELTQLAAIQQRTNFER